MAVARAVYRCSACQRQALDIGGKRIGGRALHDVCTFVGIFNYHVRTVINDVGIVTGTADQRIRANLAIQSITCAITYQDVIERITCAVDR